MGRLVTVFLVLGIIFFPVVPASAEEGTVKLRDLLLEALRNNPEIQALRARTKAAEHRIPQATSLADPMVMVGYENDGTSNLYTFNRDVNGMPSGSKWMFSLSQMFPYPGKLGLKGDMAARDAESQQAMIEAAKLSTQVRVKQIYYDLSLAYTNIDLLKDKTALYSRMEDAALARYAAGMAPQQEVLMTQTEKYMLLEREEMERQKIKSLEAMMNALLGRDGSIPLGGRPEKTAYAFYNYNIDELIRLAYENNPMIKVREKMAAGAASKVEMAQKEFYPDFTVGGTYFAKGSQQPDMWNITASINIPLYFRTKQEPALLEAESSLVETKKNVETAKLMASSSLRDDYAMVKTAASLMALYKDGLIPKSYQDFELALAGYATGKVEAITVITRLKAVLDYEFQYWEQFAQREKAVAQIAGVAGITDNEGVIQ